jgi:YVTN family beta-propeller protein
MKARSLLFAALVWGLFSWIAIWSTLARAQPFAYVTIQTSGNVSVIDTSSNTVVATVPVGPLLTDVAITPDGAFAYVGSALSSSVSVINTSSNTVVATVPVDSWPNGLAITPNGAFAYVSNV